MQKIMMGSFIFFFSSLVLAGQIRMTGTPAFSLTASGKGIRLKGSYIMVNSGDEKAKNVFPEIILDSFQVSGLPTELGPGEKHSWDFNHVVPRSKLSRLPVVGQFLLKFENHYSDLNSYSFTAPQLGVLKLNTENDSVGKTEMVLKIRKISSEIYEADYEVHNKLLEDMDLLIDVVLPQEMEMLTQLSPLILKEQASLFGNFQFKNNKGLDGSHYFAYMSAQWENRGERYVSWVSAPFHIGAQPKSAKKRAHFLKEYTMSQIFWILWFLTAVAGFLILWQFWVRPLRR